MKERKSLPRPCKRCNKRFQPSGRFDWICDDCEIKTYNRMKGG